ncbi:MAG: VWA domain-containing protein [Candidatus Obscuribacter sp.]|nr:VWA domain-containing protein [Candidatus Obscuribacter sp.]
MKLIAILTTLMLSIAPAFAGGTLVLKGRVDELALFCMAAGVVLDSTTIPTRVTRVKPGTAAYYSGVMEGDKVLKVITAADKLTLMLDRQGKRYEAQIPINMAAVRSRLAELEREDKLKFERGATTKETKPVTLSVQKATLDETKLAKAIAPYDIVILVDRSGSMNGGLGIGPQDITRWTWCRRALAGFAQFCQDRLPEGARQLTIIPFNSNFEEFKTNTPQALEHVFDSFVPEGGTNIYAPLNHVFRQHFSAGDKTRHPLLIVVMTDGLPNEGDNVQDLIISASKMVKDPSELVITFMEVGKTAESEELVDLLDHGLLHRGASLDLVTSHKFEHLVYDQAGLKRALLDAISRGGN